MIFSIGSSSKAKAASEYAELSQGRNTGERSVRLLMYSFAGQAKFFDRAQDGSIEVSKGENPLATISFRESNLRSSVL